MQIEIVKIMSAVPKPKLLQGVCFWILNSDNHSQCAGVIFNRDQKYQTAFSNYYDV